jgi:signal transduction histidine kinase
MVALAGEALMQAIFDSLGAQIVVIDRTGAVIGANRSWQRRFGTAASAALEPQGPHANYLESCRRAATAGHEAAAQLSETIAAVLEGRADTGRVEYRTQPCAGVQHWFALTVTPLTDGAGAVLLHENISVQRQLEGEILETSERERSQVGQELHDGLCQHLGGVALLAKTLSNSLTHAQRPEAGPATELAQLIYSAVGQTRAVARGLRPVELDEGGLLAALQDLAEQANLRIPCEVRTHGQPRVQSNEVATNLYRIAKEAVNNAVKHSGATRIFIRLRQSADHLTLTIEDDGTGLPRETPAGMGLRIMGYRANAMEARLTITNKAARGLSVRCSVPLADGGRAGGA